MACVGTEPGAVRRLRISSMIAVAEGPQDRPRRWICRAWYGMAEVTAGQGRTLSARQEIPGQGAAPPVGFRFHHDNAASMLLDVFYDAKSFLSALLPLSPDAMHVHGGLVLFCLVAAVVRGKRRFVLAFWAVAVICVAVEVFDLLYDLRAGWTLRWLNGAKDIVSTLLWPGILCLVAQGSRRFRRVLTRRPGASRVGIAVPARDMPLVSARLQAEDARLDGIGK